MQRLEMLPMLQNDCGHPRREELDDVSRTFGWGRLPGEGVCDYYGYCEWWSDGRCPFNRQQRVAADSEAAS